MAKKKEVITILAVRFYEGEKNPSNVEGYYVRSSNRASDGGWPRKTLVELVEKKDLTVILEKPKKVLTLAQIKEENGVKFFVATDNEQSILELPSF